MTSEPPIFEVQTLRNPVLYSYEQVQRAGRIAALLDRGRLVLCEPPEEKP